MSMRHLIGGVALAAALATNVATAGPIATADALLHWSSAAFTHTGGAIGTAFDILPGDGRFPPAPHEVYAFAENGADVDESPSGAPDGPLGETASVVAGTSAAATISGAGLATDFTAAGATASGDTPAPFGDAFAYAYLSRNIVSHVAGTLTIEVPYTVSIAGSTDDIGQVAFADALVDLFILNDVSSDDAFDEFDLLDVAFDGGGFDSGTVGGSISVSLAFAAGETGFFDSFTQAEAFAAVPAPAPLALLAMGLVLTGLRRRARS